MNNTEHLFIEIDRLKREIETMEREYVKKSTVYNVMSGAISYQKMILSEINEAEYEISSQEIAARKHLISNLLHLRKVLAGDI